MQPISEAAANAAIRAQERAELARNTTPDQRLARGVELYGWQPDADCSWCGDTGKMPVSGEYCTCDAGKRQRADDRSAQLAQDWERRWVQSNVPRRFRDYRLDRSPLPADLIDRIRSWVEADPGASGTNLLFTGSTGVGKTGGGVGALWALHERGVQPLWYVSTSALIDSLKPGGDESMLVTCQRASVLMLDDLGTTRGTDWEQDRLFALLNTRYEAERPTIITTNCAFSDLAVSIGERTVSRILEQHVMIAVDGPDRRLGG